MFNMTISKIIFIFELDDAVMSFENKFVTIIDDLSCRAYNEALLLWYEGIFFLFQISQAPGTVHAGPIVPSRGLLKCDLLYGLIRKKLAISSHSTIYNQEVSI